MTPQEYARMAVTITADNKIYFGEEKLPGCIAENGVTIQPGDRKNFTRITVEFIVVGPVNVEGKE